MGDHLKDHLIVALDRPVAVANRALVAELGDRVTWYKVGLATFSRLGPGFVRELVASGRGVFLDLKLHDIPNTVSQAVTAACEMGAGLLTVHAAGGGAMLEAATAAARAYGEAHGRRAKVLAVTVLTSQGGDVAELVSKRAALANASGCDGIICSPLEASANRAAFGAGFHIVTPGIRLNRTADDQARVATPSSAIGGGANQIVVGRPVHAAEDPRAAVDAILEDLARV